MIKIQDEKNEKEIKEYGRNVSGRVLCPGEAESTPFRK